MRAILGWAGVVVALALVPSPAAAADAVADLAAGNTRSLLADLPEAVLAALPTDLDPPLEKRSAVEQLQVVFEVGQPYEFDAGPLIVYSDQRWFSTFTPQAPKSSILELRRWPGDSRLLLYAVAGPVRSARGEGPPVAAGEFELREGATEDYAEWRGTIETELGEIPAVWVEATAVEGSETVLGALLLPGDAGLGEGAVADLTTELYTLLGRISIRSQLWGRKPGLPHGATIPLGTTVAVPGVKDEQLDPWQVALGADFTIGVPPGVQARRADAGVPVHFGFDDAKLWLRGRYLDTTGTAVVIGDATRAGYLADVPTDRQGWIEGKTPPVGAPDARQLASATFSLVKEPFIDLRKLSAAKAVRAGRWKENGFAGEWLVFRIAFAERNVEIGLPVLAGRRSPSLFWIPATWRAIGDPPAEPPVDPAERFGIKWERLSRGERAKRPWVEGQLTVPGLKVELPLDWWPASTLRSTEGFPVRLVAPEVGTVARLWRVPADQVEPLVGGEDSGWVSDPRPGVHRAAAEWRHSDGRHLYVDRDGAAFLFELAAAGGVESTVWERLGDSVQLVRPGR